MKFISYYRWLLLTDIYVCDISTGAFPITGILLTQQH